MSIQVFNLLVDRIKSLEEKLDSSINSLRNEIGKNFKFQNLLIFLGSFPTLQALGVPTKEIMEEFLKKAITVIGFVLHK